MAPMTSRERVLRTVNFQETDRVPIDLGAMKASGITVKAYNALKARLGIHTPTRIWDPRLMIASVEEAVLQRFHADVIPLDVTAAIHDLRPDGDWHPSVLYEGAEGLLPPGTQVAKDSEGRWALLDPAGNPTTFRMPRGGYYFDDVAFNAPGAKIDPAAFRPVTGFPDEQLRAMEARSKFLYENTEYAMLGWGGGVCFLGLSLITDRQSNVTMGLPSEWMMMLMTEKETCHEMMDRSVDASIQCLAAVARRGRRSVLRLGHRRGRQRHPAQRVHPAEPVGGDDQAALRQVMRLDPPQHELEGVPALLRVNLRPDPAHDRGGH